MSLSAYVCLFVFVFTYVCLRVALFWSDYVCVLCVVLALWISFCLSSWMYLCMLISKMCSVCLFVYTCVVCLMVGMLLSVRCCFCCVHVGWFVCFVCVFVLYVYGC